MIKKSKNIIKELNKKLKIESRICSKKEKISDFLELPKELTLGYSKITMIGNSSIFVEGYKSIVEYFDNYIKIKANKLYISIDGKSLDLKEMTDDELVIDGIIDNVSYQVYNGD